MQGGLPGAANLGGCGALESIVRRQALKGGLYAAICAAPPLALGRWGLLDGVRVRDRSRSMMPRPVFSRAHRKRKLCFFNLLFARQATAHPAFVDKFPGEVTAVDANVVVDGKVVTGSGPATAMEFALTLVEQLYGRDKVDQIAKPMVRVRFSVLILTFHKGLSSDRNCLVFNRFSLQTRSTRFF